MSNKLRKFKIFYFKDLDMNMVYDKHIQLITRKNNSIDIAYKDDIKVNIFSSNNSKSTQKKKSIPVKSILLDKYEFLIHTIIARNNHNEGSSFNKQVLKTVLGAVYKDMLRTLQNLQIISAVDSYIVGVSSSPIFVWDKYNIDCKTRYSSSFLKYNDKLNSCLNKYYEDLKKTSIERLGSENLYNNYVKCLSFLKLKYPNEAQLYIDNRNFQSIESKKYYQHIKDNYLNFQPNIKVDENKRIYSILTNTPKDFKHFLNIKYQVDIANSHPLLFSHYIINKYNIPINTLQTIHDIPYTNINGTCYDGKQVCNNLDKRLLEFVVNAKIPLDILKYIYLTSKGKFWDEFKFDEEVKGLPRQLIKKNLFREVFYSNSKKSLNRKFERLFAKQYPSVFSLIMQFRKQKNEEHLACIMMRLESTLFHEILKRLYKKRSCNVINIHDAIIMLDTKGTGRFKAHDIELVIKDVYREFGLIPTCSIDYFSLDTAFEQLNKMNNDRDIIDSIIKDARKYSEDTSSAYHKLSIEMLHDIEFGCKEIVVENGKPYLIEI